MISREFSQEDRGRILFVDAFDSFSNSIVGLLEQNLGVEVGFVHIDDKHVDQHLEEVLADYDGVVIGPGPGHPTNPADVGFMDKLWALSEAQMIPIFGVCLGFQSLCNSQGATVDRLNRPRHGIVTRITHANTDVFAEIGECDVTNYHSLRANLRPSTDGTPKPTPEAFWEPSEQCPTLCPLAWDLSDDLNGPILMGVRHTSKPYWGVQFHPESICTSEAGKFIITNWWTHAREWSSQNGRRQVQKEAASTEEALPALQPSVPAAIQEAKASIPASTELPAETVPTLAPSAPAVVEEVKPNGHSEHAALPQNVQAETPAIDAPKHAEAEKFESSHLAQELRSAAGTGDVVLRWGKHHAENVDAAELLDVLGQSRDEVVMLDSQGHATGRYSILGLVVPGKTLKITYRSSDRTLRYGLGAGQMFNKQLTGIEEVWPVLEEALQQHRPLNRDASARAPNPGSEPAYLPGLDQYVVGILPDESPFWGGFMGYISYEAGLETIDVALHPNCADSDVPDVNFAFFHRSIVIDHEKSEVYVQSLLPRDWSWILETGGKIGRLAGDKDATGPVGDVLNSALLDSKLAGADVARPGEEGYRGKVLECQTHLAAGDSYELCLTDETTIAAPAQGGVGINEWALYQRLRSNNPAPFGAFMRMSDVVVVGTSPERFLRWTREGKCEFRPIKGTVKKTAGMTREKACAILDSSKERAENLMIVDLIRHDLGGVVGASNTWVSKLMVVEEYHSVFQLVSVIDGQIPQGGEAAAAAPPPTGIDVLKASLPPGSMTGAPKKRSCEILSDMEKRPRGIYSGVLGYMDVGGSGDFSVVIRTLFRGAQGHAGSGAGREAWRLGAGGAVTMQSTDEGEFLEMETKASSVLGALFPSMA